MGSDADIEADAMRSSLSILVLAGMACFACAPMRQNSPSQAVVDKLAEGVEAGGVGRVEVFCMPQRLLTRVRITPTMLEHQAFCTVVITDVRLSAARNDLAKQLRRVIVRPDTHAVDLRLGVVFSDIDGRRLGAIYFERSGKRAIVDTTTVSTTRHLFRWASSMCRCAE